MKKETNKQFIHITNNNNNKHGKISQLYILRIVLFVCFSPLHSLYIYTLTFISIHIYIPFVCKSKICAVLIEKIGDVHSDVKWLLAYLYFTHFDRDNNNTNRLRVWINPHDTAERKQNQKQNQKQTVSLNLHKKWLS